MCDSIYLLNIDILLIFNEEDNIVSRYLQYVAVSNVQLTSPTRRNCRFSSRLCRRRELDTLNQQLLSSRWQRNNTLRRWQLVFFNKRSVVVTSEIKPMGVYQIFVS